MVANMKVEFEANDADLITQRIIDTLKPYLSTIDKARSEDAVFDKEGLAAYLHVDVSWINKQIAAKTIPYFHLGKYVRFKKSRIDRWVETKNIDPLPSVRLLRR